MSFTLSIGGADVDVAPLIAEDKREACIRALTVAKKDFRGVLEPDAIAAAAPLTIDELAEALLPVAGAFAITPISHFNVGAVARCNGRLIFGCNAEFGPLLLSVHAEQCAISQTLINSARCRRAGEPIECLYVTDAPCGHCRQFLAEQEYLQGKPLPIHVRGKKPVSCVSELLPEPFTPGDLKIPPGLKPLTVSMPPPCARNDVASLACECLYVLNDVSRAMYSHAESACAVCFGLGQSGIVGGAYIENAAFNPSFQPLSGALMAARFCGRDISKVSKIVMLERPGTISNKDIAQMIQKLVCPGATFDYFAC